ncbi:MAG: hypothetical protein QW199_00255 [Candidatus Pacearchaeota archaeon]
MHNAMDANYPKITKFEKFKEYIIERLEDKLCNLAAQIRPRVIKIHELDLLNDMNLKLLDKVSYYSKDFLIDQIITNAREKKKIYNKLKIPMLKFSIYSFFLVLLGGKKEIREIKILTEYAAAEDINSEFCQEWYALRYETSELVKKTERFRLYF